MISQLSTIKRIDDLRTVWKNEAADFTPWLADNLSLLGETLGINLELIETESPVGNYSLDILAEDTDSGDIVVIENQLEQTNHDHLGKLLTYTAGKKAKKIIWIVKNARDEHQAAIEWLNENTDDGVGFFLLEIQLWSIGDSLPAPKFEIIEQPNNWSRVVSASKNTPGGAAVQFKYKFWSAFNDYVFKNTNEFTKQFRQRKASSDHWYTLSIGSSQRGMSLLVNTKTNVITIEFTLESGDSKNKDQFDKLYSHKTEIENSLGKPMEWKRLDDKKVSRILLEHVCELKDETQWNTFFDWYIEYAVKVFQSFKPFLS